MAVSRLQLYAALGLLALVPVVVFALDRAAPVVWLSFVSVLVIVGSSYLMFSPGESPAHTA